MSQDDIDHIPAIVPKRDNVPPQRRGSSKKGAAGPSGGRGKGAGPAASGGAGWFASLLICLSLVAAAAACTWAWKLQEELLRANEAMTDYAMRIGDLEARLSDTDEGMSQNAAVQAVKVAELEAEVRKLWDNVWAQSKARLDKLEASTARQGKSLNGATSSLAALEAQVGGAADDIASLKSVAGDLSRLMSSAKANQAEVERVADTLNRIDLDLAKLDKRVKGNEEWVGSINAFRRQVNASLTELQGTVQSIQGVR